MMHRHVLAAALLAALISSPARASLAVSEYDALAMTSSGTDRTGVLTVDTAVGANSYVVVGVAVESDLPISGVTVGDVTLTNSIGGAFDTPGGNRGNVYLYYEAVDSLAAGDYAVTLINGVSSASKGTGAVVWLISGAAGISDVAWNGYRDDDNGGGGGPTGNVGFNLAAQLTPISDVSVDADLSAAAEGDLAVALFFAGADVGSTQYVTQITNLYGITAHELNIDQNSWQYTSTSGNLGPGMELGAEFESGWYRAGVAAVTFTPIPEPTSVTLFGLGLLTISRGRKKRQH